MSGCVGATGVVASDVVTQKPSGCPLSPHDERCRYKTDRGPAEQQRLVKNRSAPKLGSGEMPADVSESGLIG